MRIFWGAQQSAHRFAQSTIVDSGSKLEKNEGGFVSTLENNAREILLFSVSLILLLFNMLEGQTGRQPRYLGKPQR